jgi:crotonobetainyl-CoA:carnitine CoA-transferase CaiB-like acyl-CoA transferase
MFDAAFAKRDRDEWRMLLDEAGIVFECVAEVGDLLADRQMLDAGVLVPFENDAMLTIDSPFFVDGVDKVRPRKAPGVGEHSDQILREIGYDDTVIAKLRENRIVA